MYTVFSHAVLMYQNGYFLLFSQYLYVYGSVFQLGFRKTEGFRECQAGFHQWPVRSKNKAEVTMDALLNSLSKYFPSISVDQYNWVRNTFVEFEPCQGQFTLKEEELVSVASDRMLKLKHAELNLMRF